MVIGLSTPGGTAATRRFSNCAIGAIVRAGRTASARTVSGSDGALLIGRGAIFADRPGWVAVAGAGGWGLSDPSPG